MDIVGGEGNPQHRATFSVGLSRGVYSAAYFLRAIDEFDGPSGGTYDRHFAQDITAVATLPWGGELSLGVRNFMDVDPAVDEVGGYQDTVVLYLYDVAGRTPFVSYRHTF